MDELDRQKYLRLVTPEMKARYRTDPIFYNLANVLANVLEETHEEYRLTADDIRDALVVACAKASEVKSQDRKSTPSTAQN